MASRIPTPEPRWWVEDGQKMHQGNIDWLRHAQAKYGDEWRRGSLLELGSLDINGSSRSHVQAARYVGVDCVAGRGVDVVCRAGETAFEDGEFDCLISTSMCEHDATWKRSLEHNFRWLARGGILLLGWGAEGNPPHPPEPFGRVPVGDMLEVLVPHFEILEACWETRVYTPDWPGFYDIIARRRP